MFFVGDHVKLKHATSYHIGTITTINANGQMTVKFDYPFKHTYYAREDMLYKVSDKLWYDYLGIEAKQGKTGNHVIDHALDNTSVEHQIEHMFSEPEPYEDYYEGDLQAMQDMIQERLEYMLEEEMYATEAYKDEMFNDKSYKPYNGSDQTYLNAKEREDLKQMYIELALLTNDESWFNELTKGAK